MKGVRGRVRTSRRAREASRPADRKLSKELQRGPCERGGRAKPVKN